MHALVHGLFKTSDEVETRELYARVQRLFAQHHLTQPEDRAALIQLLAEDVLANFDLEPSHPERAHITALIDRLFGYEHLFVLPAIDWAERRSVTQWWELRDELNRQRGPVEQFDDTCDLIRGVVITVLEPLYEACPQLLDVSTDIDGITVETDLIQNIGNLPAITETMLTTFFADELQEAELLPRTALRLERNLVAASGGNPNDPAGFNRAPKLPTKIDISDPNELIASYLGGTPVANLFDRKVTFTIPTKSRFEHHHIIAGSGHGKTQKPR